MFPIGDVTQFGLILALIACMAALSTGYWRWITAVVSFPVFYFGILTRMGSDELGLGGTSFMIMFGIALFVGLIWGWVARRISGNISTLAIWLAVLPGLAWAGFTLERQYVPAACRDNGAQISFADQMIRIPRIDGYWEYRMARKSLTEYPWRPKQSWNSTKTKMAKFCRLTENGTLPLELMSLRIGQRYSNTEFNLLPATPVRPDWDWNDFPRTESHQFGSETDGAECYTRATEGFPTFSCAVWETPISGIRIYAVSVRKAPEDAEETVSDLRRDLSLWFGTLTIE